jgi:hypothetical protein
MPNLTWNAVLCRVDGALTVQAEPPVCESCEGSRSLLGTDMCAHPCTRCAGTGLAWHVPVVPAAGWLVGWPDGDWYVVQDRHPCGPHEYYIDALWAGDLKDDDGNIYRDEDGDTVQSPAPLLPPANTPGCTVRELLGLIGESQPCGSVEIWHPGTSAATILTVKPSEYYLAIDALRYDDTAPLEQAIQRHEALQQWLQGGQRG